MSETTVADRLKALREKHFGKRGRRAFASAIGIAPTTYHRYEIDRKLPVEVAAAACRITGEDLQWLLTGQASGRDIRLDPEHQAILDRLIKLIESRPGATGAIGGFIDLLEQHGDVGERILAERAEDARAEALINNVAEILAEAPLVPVLGRSAAGVPQFWRKDPGTVAELHSAFAQLGPRGLSARSARAAPGDAAGGTSAEAVLVQTAQPCRVGDLSVTEFVSAPAVVERVAGAFALRIDGASMSPAYENGDLVVVGPSRPARDYRPAVVQLRNQIGVTCKIYHERDGRVHLLPVNERYEPTSHDTRDVLWALEVLFRVRLG